MQTLSDLAKKDVDGSDSEFESSSSSSAVAAVMLLSVSAFLSQRMSVLRVRFSFFAGDICV